jgi:uncharacterized protein (TIGR02996 family)
LEGVLIFHIDGSETSWLVYADWLEDQGFDARHIREPQFVHYWSYDFDPTNNESVGTIYNTVGCARLGSVMVGVSDMYIGSLGKVPGSFWDDNCEVGGRPCSD